MKKKVWKILKWVGANLPMLLAFGLAFWAGFYLHDFNAMKFWIVMAAFFMVLRELSEIRWRLIALAEGPDEVEEVKGRHHGAD